MSPGEGGEGDSETGRDPGFVCRQLWFPFWVSEPVFTPKLPATGQFIPAFTQAQKNVSRHLRKTMWGAMGHG